MNAEGCRDILLELSKSFERLALNIETAALERTTTLTGRILSFNKDRGFENLYRSLAEQSWFVLSKTDFARGASEDRPAWKNWEELVANVLGESLQSDVIGLATRRSVAALSVLIQNHDTPSVPSWDKTTGTLIFQGEVVKQFRNLRQAKCLRILDAFQEENWPQRVDDPLLSSEDPLRLHNALKSLNKGLKKIHFRADGTTEGIIWEKRTT